MADIFLESFKEFFCTYSGSRVDAQLHFGNFFVNFFHEINHEINQFVAVHFFGMEIGYQKTNVVVLRANINGNTSLVFHLPILEIIDS